MLLGRGNAAHIHPGGLGLRHTVPGRFPTAAFAGYTSLLIDRTVRKLALRLEVKSSESLFVLGKILSQHIP